MDTELRERWNGLCARIGAFTSAEEAGLTYDMLGTLYAHPVRAYHNLGHIAQVLGVFDGARSLAENPDTVEFALWLHDCVYFAERPDNEERSADAAGMIAGLLGCAPEFTALARECIGATRHSVAPGRGDRSLVADIDLSILGAEGAVYDAYRRAIRREFAFAADDLFVQGRRAFIERMLDRKRIYATPYFFQSLEEAARRNLEREQRELEGGWDRGI